MNKQVSPLRLFLSGREVVFRVPYFLASDRGLLEKKLLVLLQSVGYEHYKGEIFFCIHELLSNGFKANLKRSFFKKRGFNIDHMDDYRRGMEEFRSHLKSLPVSNGIPVRCIGESSSWVKVRVHKKLNGLLFGVENNATLHYYERLRILDRECRSSQIQSLTELLLDSHDAEEGSGLGLLFLFFILKHRLKGSTFALVTEPGITRMELLFPASLSRKNSSTEKTLV